MRPSKSKTPAISVFLTSLFFRGMPLLIAWGFFFPLNAAAFNVDLDAIKIIESSGNPGAIGDGGHALGLFQLHKAAVLDVNRFLGTEFTHNDALEPLKAEKIARAYLEVVLPAYLKYFKKPITEQNIIFAYNAGILAVAKNRIPKNTRDYYDKYLKLQNL